MSFENKGGEKMSFENIGLFSLSNGKDYFKILKEQICSKAIVRHIHVAGGYSGSIDKLCRTSKFDCIILIDELVDSYTSREEVKKIIEKIEELTTSRIIVLSSWSDTPKGDDLILVESNESTRDKCQKILALIS